jgi:hypothetical protein
LIIVEPELSLLVCQCLLCLNSFALNLNGTPSMCLAIVISEQCVHVPIVIYFPIFSLVFGTFLYLTICNYLSDGQWNVNQSCFLYIMVVLKHVW